MIAESKRLAEHNDVLIELSNGITLEVTKDVETFYNNLCQIAASSTPIFNILGPVDKLQPAYDADDEIFICFIHFTYSQTRIDNDYDLFEKILKGYSSIRSNKDLRASYRWNKHTPLLTPIMVSPNFKIRNVIEGLQYFLEAYENNSLTVSAETEEMMNFKKLVRNIVSFSTKLDKETLQLYLYPDNYFFSSWSYHMEFVNNNFIEDVFEQGSAQNNSNRNQKYVSIVQKFFTQEIIQGRNSVWCNYFYENRSRLTPRLVVDSWLLSQEYNHEWAVALL